MFGSEGEIQNSRFKIKRTELLVELARHNAVVDDEIGVDGFEADGREQDGDLGAVIGGVIDDVNYDHLKAVGEGIAGEIPVGHFPVEVVGAFDKVLPLFPGLVRQCPQLFQFVFAPQLQIGRWKRLDPIQPHELRGKDVAHEAEDLFIAHVLTDEAIHHALVRPRVVLAEFQKKLFHREIAETRRNLRTESNHGAGFVFTPVIVSKK